MIKNVIFDIGNVLMSFDWEPYITELLGAESAAAVSDAIWTSGYWHEFDRGVMSDDEIITKFLEDSNGHEREVMLALQNIGGCMKKRDYAIGWINELKASGYRVFYLSNYSEFLMNKKPDVLDFLPHTDGGIFSCHVKLTKPDSRIYAAICNKYGLAPSECLFIDDKAENISAAMDFGMQGIQFTGYEETYQKVSEALKA